MRGMNVSTSSICAASSITTLSYYNNDTDQNSKGEGLINMQTQQQNKQMGGAMSAIKHATGKRLIISLQGYNYTWVGY